MRSAMVVEDAAGSRSVQGLDPGEKDPEIWSERQGQQTARQQPASLLGLKHVKEAPSVERTPPVAQTDLAA